MYENITNGEWKKYRILSQQLLTGSDFSESWIADSHIIDSFVWILSILLSLISLSNSILSGVSFDDTLFILGVT